MNLKIVRHSMYFETSAKLLPFGISVVKASRTTCNGDAKIKWWYGCSSKPKRKPKTFEQDVVVFFCYFEDHRSRILICCKTPCPLLDAQVPFKPFRFGRNGYGDDVFLLNSWGRASVPRVIAGTRICKLVTRSLLVFGHQVEASPILECEDLSFPKNHTLVEVRCEQILTRRYGAYTSASWLSN